MDTTNKHLGNVLSQKTDEEIKEILEQVAKKSDSSVEDVLNRFSIISKCERFYYDGSMREDSDEE